MVLQGGLVVPMDGPPDNPVGTVRERDLFLAGDGIQAVMEPGSPVPRGARVLDATGLVILPGFIQGHVHPCQTLIRGLADDLPLLEWLQQRIWPLEAAHDPDTMAVSAALTAHELLRGGTTAVMGMDSIHHTTATAETFANTPLAAILGNCIMDVAEGTPPGWVPGSTTARNITEQVHREVQRHDNLHYAVSPRFVLSVSDGLARDMADYARENGLRVHTHAGEHPAEVAAVRARFGKDYLEVLSEQGWLGRHAGIAHCVHTTPDEKTLLRDSGAAVLHCPCANLKLGSGIAPIHAYRQAGIPVALGADGAPCNNRLSALRELRTAAQLQAATAGPGAWPAAQALYALTRGGAEALGLADRHGSIAPGKRADLVCLDLRGACHGSVGPTWTAPHELVSHIVYTAGDSCIRHVIAGGQHAVQNGLVRVAGLPTDEWQPHEQQAAGSDGPPANRPLGDAVEQARSSLLARAGLAR